MEGEASLPDRSGVGECLTHVRQAGYRSSPTPREEGREDAGRPDRGRSCCLLYYYCSTVILEGDVDPPGAASIGCDDRIGRTLDPGPTRLTGTEVRHSPTFLIDPMAMQAGRADAGACAQSS